jgi:parvulin-like peptidyl-prolyl isomerase
MIADLFAERIEVADSSIDSFYQANIEQVTTPEKRKATHILISDNPKAWLADGVDVSGLTDVELEHMAKERAEELYQQVKTGADIGELAYRHSHDSYTKASKGSLGVFSRGEMVEEFEDHVFDMQEGELSRPFKTPYGYHVVSLDSIIPQEVRPLDDELQEEIRLILLRQQEQELVLPFIDSLKEQADYTWNDELLQKNPGEYDTDDWVCIVNGIDTIKASNLSNRELRLRTARKKLVFSVEDRKDLVLENVTPHLMMAAAIEMGYLDSDTGQSLYNTFHRNEVANRILNERALIEWAPSEEALRAYYDEHIDEYNAERPVKVKQIVFPDSAGAVAVLMELPDTVNFDSLAEVHYPGDPDVKQAAVDLGWISDEEMGRDFFGAAWIAEVGEIVGPVRTEWGYHIIKVVDKKPQLEFAGARTQVMRDLRDEVRLQKEQDWIDWLTEGKDIEIFHDVLDQVDFSNYDYYVQLTDSLSQAAVADSVS